MRFQKTSLLVKLVILVVVVCATVTLISLQSQLQEASAANAEKEQQISALAQDNEKMAAVNDDMQTYQRSYDTAAIAAGDEADPLQVAGSIDSDAMDAAARAQGYVDPDEIIFEDVND